MNIPDSLDCVETHFENVKRVLSLVDPKRIVEAVEILNGVRSTYRTVWIVGNGGSAATASHFANDLWKMAKIKAVAVPSLIPIVTAYGNDNGWDNMFADVLKHKFEPGDVLVAISCSGRSKNVVEAVKKVLEWQENVIAITGAGIDSNVLAQLDVTKILVTDIDIKVQEDVHLAICHAIITALTW